MIHGRQRPVTGAYIQHEIPTVAAQLRQLMGFPIAKQEPKVDVFVVYKVE